MCNRILPITVPGPYAVGVQEDKDETKKENKTCSDFLLYSEKWETNCILGLMWLSYSPTNSVGVLTVHLVRELY